MIPNKIVEEAAKKAYLSGKIPVGESDIPTIEAFKDGHKHSTKIWIEFCKWYSGMQEKDIKKVFDQFMEERGYWEEKKKMAVPDIGSKPIGLTAQQEVDFKEIWKECKHPLLI